VHAAHKLQFELKKQSVKDTVHRRLAGQYASEGPPGETAECMLLSECTSTVEQAKGAVGMKLPS
jgi:hypothetical protein